MGLLPGSPSRLSIQQPSSTTTLYSVSSRPVRNTRASRVLHRVLLLGRILLSIACAALLVIIGRCWLHELATERRHSERHDSGSATSAIQQLVIQIQNIVHRDRRTLSLVTAICCLFSWLLSRRDGLGLNDHSFLFTPILMCTRRRIIACHSGARDPAIDISVELPLYIDFSLHTVLANSGHLHTRGIQGLRGAVLHGSDRRQRERRHCGLSEASAATRNTRTSLAWRTQRSVRAEEDGYGRFASLMTLLEPRFPPLP